MSPDVSELLKKALALPPEARAALAGSLLESLDDTPSKEMALKFELLSKLAHPDDPTIIPLWENEA